MADRKELAVTFDGSFEGFLCIIYAYYYDGIIPLYIQTDEDYQQALDVEEYHVSTDLDKAMQVQLGIRNKISAQAEGYLAYNFLAEGNDKYMEMFRYILLGFKVGYKVDNHMQQDYVMGVQKRARYVGREAHLLFGFTRFAETKQGIFYSAISPINDVLELVAEHFRDRMMNQTWVVHDKKRHKAAVYDGNEYAIGDVPKSVNVEFGDKEEFIQDLWAAFFESVTIKERINKPLQRNLLPLHFRKNMLEFQTQMTQMTMAQKNVK